MRAIREGGALSAAVQSPMGRGGTNAIHTDAAAAPPVSTVARCCTGEGNLAAREPRSLPSYAIDTPTRGS